jgi:serine/threonine protein kinase
MSHPRPPSVQIEVSPPPVGAPIKFGKYTLFDRLGRGGMAEVWKARMLGPAGFQRTLVVKRILPHLLEDAHFVDMFTAEARLSARLNHANIVQVFELGDVDGEYYLAMEYVRGRDLVSVMRTQLLRGLPDPGMGAYAVREVCRALAYAHALDDDEGRPLKLVHRDVSPANVMFSFDGAVKLLDFGIAKALSEASDNKTQTGMLKGKFGYMAPEQVEGRAFDHRSDLFAAGIVLHETLTGRRLFKGQYELQTIAMVREARVEPPSLLNPAVSPELDRITLKALARNPDDRYATCDEMAHDLDQVLHQLNWGADRLRATMHQLFADEQPETNVSELPLDRHAHVTALEAMSRRRRRLMALAGAGALALLIGGIFVSGTPRKPPQPALGTTSPPPLPAPVEVKVRVNSTPPNADVLVDGETQPRGRTPVTIRLPRADEPRMLVVRLIGYHEERVEVLPDSDTAAQVALTPEAPAPVKPVRAEKSKRPAGKASTSAAKSTKPKPVPTRASPDLKRGDVVDPFAR